MVQSRTRLRLLVAMATCLGVYVAWQNRPESRRYPKLDYGGYTLIDLGHTDHFGTNHLEQLLSLIERGADVNVINDEGRTPLISVCWAFRYAVGVAKTDAKFLVDYVAMLLEHGADPDLGTGRGYGSPLCVLVGSLRDDAGGSEYATTHILSAMKLLLDNGADINARDKNGNTPLMITARSASSNSWFAARTLLEHGADPNLRNNVGRTAISFAAGSGALRTVEDLIDRGADVDLSDNDGNRPLFFAKRWESLIEDKKCSVWRTEGTIRLDVAKRPMEYTERQEKLRQEKLREYQSVAGILSGTLPHTQENPNPDKP